MALLFILQLKRAIKAVPKLILGALLPLLLSALAILYVRHMSSGEQHQTLVSPIALVNYDEKADLDFMLPFFSEIDATTGFRFVEMEEAAAMTALSSGTVCAVLIFPENMLSGILNATNTPARLYLPENSAIASLLIGKFAQAGSQTLSVAQSCIYTASDLYYDYGLDEHCDEIYYDLNLATLNYALAREKLFSTRSVSATGSLSLLTYYGATLTLCLLLFFCSGMGTFLCNASGATLRQQLSRNGIGPLRYEFSLFAPLFLFYSLLTAASVAIAGRILGGISVTTLPLCFLVSVVLCLALYAQLVFRFFADAGRGLLVFLFSGLFMIFIAGGFLPYAFLPVLFQKLTPLLPFGAILNGLRHLFGNTLTTADVANVLWHCLALTLVLLPVSIFFRKEEHA